MDILCIKQEYCVFFCNAIVCIITERLSNNFGLSIHDRFKYITHNSAMKAPMIDSKDHHEGFSMGNYLGREKWLDIAKLLAAILIVF